MSTATRSDDDLSPALEAAYYRHVPAEEVADRSGEDRRGALRSHLELAARRPPGTARVRVLTPTRERDGWSAGGRSVIEIVVDDMPFLVDSVTMELSRQRYDVHLVVHPVLALTRDVVGDLLDPTQGPDAESWMHVETDRIRPEAEADVVAALERVLADCRGAAEDEAKLRDRLDHVIDALPTTPVPEAERSQVAALLRWLAEDRFVFLGYREYRVDGEGTLPDGTSGPEYLRPVPGTGLGILRADPDLSDAACRLPERVRAKALEPRLLILTKANARATVHRPVRLDYLGIKVFDGDRVVGEQRFLGLVTSDAVAESVTRVPVLREKVAQILARLGLDARGHDGKALVEVLEAFPRGWLFEAEVEELTGLATAAMVSRGRRALRVVARPDPYGRFVTVLVGLSRDHYSTAVRERWASILRERLGGTDVDYTVRIGESATARVQLVVHLPADAPAPEAAGAELSAELWADLEQRLAEAARSWPDDLQLAIDDAYGEQAGGPLRRRYAAAFPAAYREDYDPSAGAVDAARLAAIEAGPNQRGGIDLHLAAPADGVARFKIYRVGEPLSLSRVLPILTSTGVEVVDERPYQLDGLDRRECVYDFGLRLPVTTDERDRARFAAAVRAVWEDRAETDGLNALVLAAGLDWRQAVVLRGYARYLRQAGTPFAQGTIEAALCGHAGIARDLVELFAARFDPARERGGEEAVAARIRTELDEVASLDEDRILRSYLTLIQATVRTSFYREGAQDRVSFKLDPRRIPDLPEPRPWAEIFVYSPAVEGVHLRFGPVARGGLRWSDRRDDFRTEALGLVKAQQVKNTVIVPVGAKGAFVVKQGVGLEAGRTAYRSFVAGLLDLTDNLVDDPETGQRTVPPAGVVRHDADDSYLVVAADKGTATFSDLANSVAADYGFWLGDAFASGGSAGYDHKEMGITARGAWVSAERHFRERGLDPDVQDFTAVGIGDMSGDVFGNGMLLSRHLRLVAAFDHRDIFIDPYPDPATSYAERQRLFELPRSSWADYDRALISPGGGVWARTSKSVPVSPEAREALGLPDDVARLTPTALISAILRAPVDLLFNGGVGTYVKGSGETAAEVGDKANDALRVNGAELRAAAVVEGGNLGLTQAGRVEYALRGIEGLGGRVNTDFIDNSAGVDTSDREVNLKILLQGALPERERDELLVSMTDEVAALVLRNNDEQNLALADAVHHATGLLHVHEEVMADFEARGVLDREVEGLPSSEEVRRRLDAGGALTVPELAVLMSWTKIELARELLATDVPDDPAYADRLTAYFPSAVRERFADRIAGHPLRREIVTTQLVGEIVGGGGITLLHRLTEETGASLPDLVRAHLAARELFGWDLVRHEIHALDHQVDAAIQTRMRVELRTLVERTTRWLVTHPYDAGLAEPVRRTLDALPGLLTGRDEAAFESRLATLAKNGVPEELGERIASFPAAPALLGVAETALARDLDPVEVARVHLALGERLGLPLLLDRVVALPRRDRWEAMARAALREDLGAAHAALTGQVLDTAGGDVEAWARTEAVTRATATLAELCHDDGADLARLSVALRTVRSLL
ncbi:NAD-glutamate dehydrogenase [Nocardioides sp.]|uniref:NAD-glutamate dehydrogenase n=1 Tax=Nocardioides sp. TaxID=35761 RepID=UPI0039E4C082